MQVASCPDVKKGRDGKTPCEKLHGKKPTQEFVQFGEKLFAKQITTDPMNRISPPVQVRDLAWTAKQQRGNADGVFRAREIRRLEPRRRWDTEAANSVIWSTLENDRHTASGQWTDQRSEWTPSQSLFCHSRERESRRRESSCKTSTNSEPPLDAQAANAIKENKRAQAHSGRCRGIIEACLRVTPHGAERLDQKK